MQKEITTVAQAELRRLKTKREENALPVLRQSPKFSDYVKQYLDYFNTVKDAKRPGTVQRERSILNHWIEHLGDTRLDKISRSRINRFIEKRQAAGVTCRTVNLEVIGLRNVLKRAIDDNWINRLLPQQGRAVDL